MDFRYGTAFAVPPPEAYERLLLDAMLGDPTLYTRTDEVRKRLAFHHRRSSTPGNSPAPRPRLLRRRQLGARSRRCLDRSRRRPAGAGSDQVRLDPHAYLGIRRTS